MTEKTSEEALRSASAETDKSTFAAIGHSIETLEEELAAHQAKRMRIWRIRTVLTAIVIGIAHYFDHDLWWLWLLPLASLLLMGLMYGKTRRRLQALKQQLPED